MSEKLTKEVAGQLQRLAAHDTEMQLINYPATMTLLRLGLAEEIPGNLGRKIARITPAGHKALEGKAPHE